MVCDVEVHFSEPHFITAYLVVVAQFLILHYVMDKDYCLNRKTIIYTKNLLVIIRIFSLLNRFLKDLFK